MTLLNKQAGDSFGGFNDNAHIGFMVGNRFCLLTSIGKTTWVVDSGARDHITPNLSLLIDGKTIDQYCCITMPNGESKQIKHLGSIQIGADLLLKDVLHVHEFQYNFLSVSKLTK